MAAGGVGKRGRADWQVDKPSQLSLPAQLVMGLEDGDMAGHVFEHVKSSGG